MDAFLKKLFIEYMLKCEDKIYYGESQVKKLISFIIKEFALKNKLEYYKYTWDDTEDNFYEKVEVFKQDLHTILEKQKRILKYKKSILYKKSQIFSKIYHLTEDEYNTFVYFYVFKHYRYHQIFLNAITTNNNFYDYYGMTKNIFDYNEYVDKKI